MKRYFNKLTILQKIFVGGTIFFIPIIVFLFYMVSGFNNSIGFTRLELSGSKVLMPLQGLAELILQHQLYVRLYIEGDKAAEEKVNLLSQAIEKHLAVLRKEGKEQEGVLQITQKNMRDAGLEQSHFSQIHKDWQELRSNWKDTLQNDEIHERILKAIQTLTKRVGITSNIVLDSGHDTYYIIDVGLMAMPRIQERLGAFMLFAESVIFKKSMSQQDMIKFSTFAAMLEEDFERVRQSAQTAIRVNKKLYGDNTSLQNNLQPLLAQYETSVIPFLAIVMWLANDTSFKIPIGDFLTPAHDVLHLGAKLREASVAEAQYLLNKRVSDGVNKRFLALALSLSTLLFAIIVIIIISRGIARSLGRVIDIAGDIAGGNLQKAMELVHETGKAESYLGGMPEQPSGKQRNEIYRLFQAIATMTSSLHSLLTQVGKSGIQVNTSSTQIAAAARQLEATVSEQVASINEVCAASGEISATSKEFAKTMNNVAEMASKDAELARTSMASLSDINSTMKKLLESTTESSGKLKTVREKMENITQVIITITNVANQINLLSLNAAIEAEKAGEYGIGFSVVAREIRRLADQTAMAAFDIEGMIVETQDAMRDGVTAVEAYTDQTRTSTERIAEISIDLLQAIEHTQDLVPQFDAVNRGMQMQSESAAQISDAMGQLNEAAEQTGLSLEEFKSVTDQLNEAVKDLQNEVARFSISS